MNEINKPKDVTEAESKKFENCPLAKQLDNKVDDSKDTNYDSPIVKEVKKHFDDNGNVYLENGKRLPNFEYVLNGNIYKTDEMGRITNVYAKPQLTPENTRDLSAQRDAGGEYRREGDAGGHIVGRDLGGDDGLGNIVAMDSRINGSDYKKKENNEKAALKDGKDVTTNTKLYYSGESERPDRIDATVTIDGNKTVYKFDNNIDGSLMSEVPEFGKKDVQNSLDTFGGNISSIKEEYNSNGELEKTTVTVTYTDENGKNQRDYVTIDGGN